MIASLTLLAGASVAQPATAPAAEVPAPHTANNTTSPTLAPTLAEMLQGLSADEQVFHQHLVTLTSPFFEGRGPGTRGNELTAEYLEFFFRGSGLKPAFPDAAQLKATEPEAGQAEAQPAADKPDAAAAAAAASAKRLAAPKVAFRQAFPAGRKVRVNAQEVKFSTAGGATTGLEPTKDFTVRGNSGNGKIEALPVVFVGYAIQDGPDGYKTFAEGDDLTGKVAVMLRFEPLDGKGASRWTKDDGGGFTQRAALSSKLQAVIERKPAAVVLVMPPGVDDPRAGTLETTAGTTRRERVQSVPVINASVEAVDRLARAAGTTLAELRAGADTAGGVRELAGVTVSMDVGVLREATMVDNVGGVIPGAGVLAEQYVVIGAHLDHLGYGDSGSRGGPAANGKLHPGADDNASGTAGLLLAAEMLARQAAKQDQQSGKDGTPAQRRSIMLLAFNAEESGLIGSRFFVANAPVSAEKVDAMLNMDMIGRVRNDRLEVSGVGSAEGFADMLKPQWDSSGLSVRTLPGGSGPSDHASFYRAGIPVLHFFSGLHPEYHMPSDLYPTVNTPGAVKVVRTVVNVAAMLAARPEGLRYTKATGPSIDMNMDRENIRPATPPSAPTPAGEPATEPANKPAQNPRSAAPEAVPTPTPATTPVSVTPTPASPHSGDQTASTGTGVPGTGVAGTGMGGSRVRFGIAPGDYSGSGGGVEVAEVFPGTPAAVAGLKQGDRIIKWNDTKITDVEDWMPQLTRANPGDKVTITLLRAGETVVVECVLRARGGAE